VLSIYHATDITFGVNQAAVKIVENHLGRRRVKVQQQLMINLPIGPIQPPAVVPGQPVAPSPPGPEPAGQQPQEAPSPPGPEQQESREH
jgi:hypothetical protein